MSEVARHIADIDDVAEIHDLLDEVEDMYDALDPVQRELVEEVIERLRARLALLS